MKTTITIVLLSTLLVFGKCMDQSEITQLQQMQTQKSKNDKWWKNNNLNKNLLSIWEKHSPNRKRHGERLHAELLPKYPELENVSRKNLREHGLRLYRKRTQPEQLHRANIPMELKTSLLNIFDETNTGEKYHSRRIHEQWCNRHKEHSYIDQYKLYGLVKYLDNKRQEDKNKHNDIMKTTPKVRRTRRKSVESLYRCTRKVKSDDIKVDDSENQENHAETSQRIIKKPRSRHYQKDPRHVTKENITPGNGGELTRDHSVNSPVIQHQQIQTHEVDLIHGAYNPTLHTDLIRSYCHPASNFVPYDRTTCFIRSQQMPSNYEISHYPPIEYNDHDASARHTDDNSSDSTFNVNDYLLSDSELS